MSLVGAVGEDGDWLVRDLEGYGVSVADVSIVKVLLQSYPNGSSADLFSFRRRSQVEPSSNLPQKAKIVSVCLSLYPRR